MKPTLLLTACATLVLMGCSTTETPAPSTSDAAVEYVGETTNGALPQPEDVPPVEDWSEDAGTFVIDQRCCNVVFQIPAEEPADATGVVRASFASLRDGLPLARTDAGWNATFCMPLNAVILYHYEFTYASDAGALFLDDAGVDTDAGLEPADGGIDAGPTLVTVVRASPDAPSGPDGQGNQTNVYQVATDCGAADASVGTYP